MLICGNRGENAGRVYGWRHGCPQRHCADTLRGSGWLPEKRPDAQPENKFPFTVYAEQIL